MLLNKMITDNLSLNYGLQATTMLYSNSLNLPVSTFGALDIDANIGGNYNFDNGTEAMFSLRQRLYQFGDNASKIPALETKPVNLNLGLKF